jgi:hypothetical protein
MKQELSSDHYKEWHPTLQCTPASCRFGCVKPRRQKKKERFEGAPFNPLKEDNQWKLSGYVWLLQCRALAQIERLNLMERYHVDRGPERRLTAHFAARHESHRGQRVWHFVATIQAHLVCVVLDGERTADIVVPAAKQKV